MSERPGAESLTARLVRAVVEELRDDDPMFIIGIGPTELWIGWSACADPDCACARCQGDWCGDVGNVVYGGKSVADLCTPDE